MKELGILVADQGEHSDQDRKLQVLDAPQDRLEQPDLEMGWVITSSAPASFFLSRRRISLSRSAAPGSRPVARRNAVLPPGNGLPAGSTPRFMLEAIWRRPMASRSYTAVASG